MNLDFGQKPSLESMGFPSLGEAQVPCAKIASEGKLSLSPRIPLVVYILSKNTCCSLNVETGATFGGSVPSSVS